MVYFASADHESDYPTLCFVKQRHNPCYPFAYEKVDISNFFSQNSRWIGIVRLSSPTDKQHLSIPLIAVEKSRYEFPPRKGTYDADGF